MILVLIVLRLLVGIVVLSLNVVMLGWILQDRDLVKLNKINGIVRKLIQGKVRDGYFFLFFNGALTALAIVSLSLYMTEYRPLQPQHNISGAVVLAIQVVFGIWGLLRWREYRSLYEMAMEEEKKMAALKSLQGVQEV